MSFVDRWLKGSGSNVDKARSDFKKNICKYVLDSKRVKGFESSHPDFVNKVKAIQAELKAQSGGDSIGGKIKNAVLDKITGPSISRIKRKDAQKGDESATGILNAESDNDD